VEQAWLSPGAFSTSFVINSLRHCVPEGGKSPPYSEAWPSPEPGAVGGEGNAGISLEIHTALPPLEGSLGDPPPGPCFGPGLPEARRSSAGLHATEVRRSSAGHHAACPLGWPPARGQVPSTVPSHRFSPGKKPLAGRLKNRTDPLQSTVTDKILSAVFQLCR